MYLAERDGGKCITCGVSESEKSLEVDHIDGDPFNNALENLRLLCHGCNVREYHRKAREMIRRQSSSIVSRSLDAADSGAGESASENVGRVVDAERESPEIQINRVKEPLYVATALEMLLRSEGLTVYDAIYEVSQRIGISPATARRYLLKMTSKAGPLRVGEGPRGRQRLYFREEHWRVGA
jgi:hypothetical protein